MKTEKEIRNKMKEYFRLKADTDNETVREAALERFKALKWVVSDDWK